MPSKGPPPAPLGQEIVDKLLDQLTDSPDFRRFFSRDAKAAIESLGYVPPKGEEASHIGGCLQMAVGKSLASPEEIQAKRAKLQTSLNAIQDFSCPTDICPG